MSKASEARGLEHLVRAQLQLCKQPVKFVRARFQMFKQPLKIVIPSEAEGPFFVRARLQPCRTSERGDRL